jgi:hypothetical protein
MLLNIIKRVMPVDPPHIEPLVACVTAKMP